MRKKTVLIIEDGQPLANAVALRCEKEKWSTICAPDGREGFVIAVREKPDIIILDIFLPKMDGKDVLKKLRKDKWGKDALVIILTNLSESKGVPIIAEYNPVRYLVKTSTTLDELAAVIKKYI